MFDLAKLQQERTLVSIRRDGIDDHTLLGYVLARSEALVAIQRVEDFRLDGLTILRRADITAVDCGDKVAFYGELLAAEGLLAQVPFGLALDLHDWRAAITQLSREHGFMIIECEDRDEPDFFIGRVVYSNEALVRFKFFSSTARWNETADEIAFADITCCQVDSHYLTVYRRHFERQAGAAASAGE